MLVPESINAIVDRHQEGINVGHERDNWKKGKDDPSFVKERVNHLFEHIIAITTGIHPREGRKALPEDVDAALCNLQMISWFQKNGTGLGIAFPNIAETIVKESHGN